MENACLMRADDLSIIRDRGGAQDARIDRVWASKSSRYFRTCMERVDFNIGGDYKLARKWVRDQVTYVVVVEEGIILSILTWMFTTMIWMWRLHVCS